MRRLGRTFLCGLLFAGAQLAVAGDGVSNTTIRIGQTIGITGQIAAPVREMNQAAYAYIQRVNARGGVHGRTIEVVTLDDKFDPKLAASNARKLITEEHVFALFQSRGTPHTEAILPLLAEYGVPLVAPSTGATALHTPVNRFLFNVRSRYQAEVIKAVAQFQQTGITRIALAHVDDSFGRDALAGFNTGMASAKLAPAAVIAFSREKPDVKATVDAVVRADPQITIIVSSAPTAAGIINALRASGNKMQVMTLSNNSSTGFIESLGKNAPGIIVTQVTPPPDLLITELGQELKSLAKQYGLTPSYAAMEGLIAAKVLVEGLRRSDRALTREAFIRALESIRQYDLGGLSIHYQPDDHSGSEFVEMTMIGKDGRFRR